MMTAVWYVLIIAAVGGLLFVVASFVFGRGERLDPLPKGVSPAWLPEHAVDGDDVRALRFQQSLRGYDTAEVDWALHRLAAEVDRLRAALAARDADVPPGRGLLEDDGDGPPAAGRVRRAYNDGEQ